MTLSVEALSYRYPGGPPILDGFTAAFAGGEIVAITGPSGRGKSTLMYLLGLMLRPSAGRVMLDARPVSTLSDRERSAIRASSMGFVFQDAALDPTRSIRDNVLETALYRGEPRGALDERVASLLDLLGVALRADAKPGQVSGGQAQRIALARALVHDPSVLLCDEPTGNLDPASTATVLRTLTDHARAGNSVIVVTHDQHVVDHCDREVQL